MRRKIRAFGIGIFALTVVFSSGWELGHSGKSIVPISDAEAAGGQIRGPNEIAPDRYVYYPGTEKLAEGEVRVIACGTGMPDQRRGPKS